MSERLTGCKRGRAIAAFALVFLLCAAIPLACTAAGDGETVGRVPVLLYASGQRDALYEECSLGDALADAVARCVDCDVVILNGGDLTGNLQPGMTTRAMLEECITPDRQIATVRISPQRLAELLEAALSHAVLGPDRAYLLPDARHGAFPQISGIQLIYDPAAQAGQRLVRVTVGDKPLDLSDNDAVLTLAATSHMLEGGYEMPSVTGYIPADKTLTDAMEAYIRAGMEDYERPGKRIRAAGVRSENLQIGYLALLAGVIVAVFLIGSASLRKRTARRDLLSTGQLQQTQQMDETRTSCPQGHRGRPF